ncbi:capsule biosynthesis GfcC family protein [Polycyclovorans algicola]|uniref:capsule biosynthesis GfcC family protein n=1 Tax=Polycyclovorans algicola TaxID=616992 RepID=UPI001267971D|nr:capsule biosynthesis GfcC family protein [Polycyclovorans algicola]
MSTLEHKGRQSPAFFLSNGAVYAVIAWAAMLVSGGANLALAQSDTRDSVVTVTGAVEKPIRVNGPVKLSDAIKVAGGYREGAYPYGSLLLRRSDLQVGMTVCMASAAELLRMQLALSGGSELTGAGSLTAGIDLGQYIRIPISLSPGPTIAEAQADVTLVTGDILYVPFRPTSVAIISPGNDETVIVNYRPGWKADEYLNAADIKTNWSSNEFRIYLPNGDQDLLKLNLWNYELQVVPPGSVITSRDKKKKIDDSCLGL